MFSEYQEIQMQGAILQEITVKVDKTNTKFVVANRKMKELLEEVCEMALHGNLCLKRCVNGFAWECVFS